MGDGSNRVPNTPHLIPKNTTMLNYLLVFLGGGLGSMCRYGIAHGLSNYKTTFPFATLIANIISCLILGYLVGLSLKNQTSDYQRFLWMTGFCGGFSTFSTFFFYLYYHKKGVWPNE